MSITRSPLPLRSLLVLDAATCTLMGAILALGSRPIGAATQLPPALLLYAGLALLPIAAFMAFVAARQPVSSAGAWLVIAGNAGWVAASVGLLAAGRVEPNALGTAFVAAQAAAVAALAWLEYSALREARPELQPVGQ